VREQKGGGLAPRLPHPWSVHFLKRLPAFCVLHQVSLSYYFKL
jgi:hypothetical protein